MIPMVWECIFMAGGLHTELKGIKKRRSFNPIPSFYRRGNPKPQFKEEGRHKGEKGSLHFGPNLPFHHKIGLLHSMPQPHSLFRRYLDMLYKPCACVLPSPCTLLSPLCGDFTHSSLPDSKTNFSKRLPAAAIGTSFAFPAACFPNDNGGRYGILHGITWLTL